MARGTVKWFNDHKGYGFISTEEQQEVEIRVVLVLAERLARQMSRRGAIATLHAAVKLPDQLLNAGLVEMERLSQQIPRLLPVRVLQALESAGEGPRFVHRRLLAQRPQRGQGFRQPALPGVEQRDLGTRRDVARIDAQRLLEASPSLQPLSGGEPRTAEAVVHVRETRRQPGRFQQRALSLIALPGGFGHAGDVDQGIHGGGAMLRMERRPCEGSDQGLDRLLVTAVPRQLEAGLEGIVLALERARAHAAPPSRRMT